MAAIAHRRHLAFLVRSLELTREDLRLRIHHEVPALLRGRGRRLRSLQAASEDINISEGRRYVLAREAALEQQLRDADESVLSPLLDAGAVRSCAVSAERVPVAVPLHACDDAASAIDAVAQCDDAEEVQQYVLQHVEEADALACAPHEPLLDDEGEDLAAAHSADEARILLRVRAAHGPMQQRQDDVFLQDTPSYAGLAAVDRFTPQAAGDGAHEPHSSPSTAERRSDGAANAVLTSVGCGAAEGGARCSSVRVWSVCAAAEVAWADTYEDLQVFKVSLRSCEQALTGGQLQQFQVGAWLETETMHASCILLQVRIWFCYVCHQRQGTSSERAWPRWNVMCSSAWACAMVVAAAQAALIDCAPAGRAVVILDPEFVTWLHREREVDSFLSRPDYVKDVLAARLGPDAPTMHTPRLLVFPVHVHARSHWVRTLGLGASLGVYAGNMRSRGNGRASGALASMCTSVNTYNMC